MWHESSLKHLLGKRISGILVSENQSPPRYQLFIAFDDGTYFEFYGDAIKAAGGVDTGGQEEITAYAKKFRGQLTSYF